MNKNVKNIGDKGGGGVKPRHGMVGPAGGIHKLVVSFFELGNFLVCVGVGLSYPNTGNTALYRCVNDGVALSAVIKGAAHGFTEMHGNDHQNRNAGEDN